MGLTRRSFLKSLLIGAGIAAVNPAKAAAIF